MLGHRDALDELERDLSIDIDALVRRGPRSRAALIRLADRGDWRARVLAVSGVGRLVREDATSVRRWSLYGRVLARVPGLRRHLPTVGRRGGLVSRSLLNASIDPSFIVRTAAALALGECADPALAPALLAMHADPFRPVRLAAAAALVACGGPPPLPGAAGADVESTPAQMAEGVSTLDWLRRLASAHRALLDGAAPSLGGPSAGSEDAYARWLAGPVHLSGTGGASAEAVRYDHERDLEYQLAKPFGPQDRADNIRQLDAFIALVAHLDLPRGARVLDVGGGSGWVSELLAKFGFDPVVVDVAQPLLRLAKQRVAERTYRLQAVAGDMTSLPIRSGRIDAAIAIDALHHVEDLSAVLAEVRRVLVPGGKFLIAEPGEGHSESPKSLAEAREQGVRESEVHPLGLARLAAGAGFDRVALLPRVPAQATIDVADLRVAMNQPAEAWPVHNAGSVTRFDTLVLRSMLARPLLVLQAGRRVPDTRAPGVLTADVRTALVRDRDLLTGEIELRNTGDTEWLARSRDGTGVVWVGLQLLDRDGRMLNRELARTPLSASVAPGGRCRVPVSAQLPTIGDPYRLKIDLVADRVCWFEDRGSRTVHLDV